MYRYNDNGKLITSAIPLQGLTQVNMTDEEAKHCIGFDSNGNPKYNQAAIDAEIQAAKQKQIDSINAEFERKCSKVGVLYEGNYFQYDDISRSRLLETKDDARVTFWRSVDNTNITMNNAKKNELYEVLKLTYYTKFAEKSVSIDALG